MFLHCLAHIQTTRIGATCVKRDTEHKRLSIRLLNVTGVCDPDLPQDSCPVL